MGFSYHAVVFFRLGVLTSLFTQARPKCTAVTPLHTHPQSQWLKKAKDYFSTHTTWLTWFTAAQDTDDAGCILSGIPTVSAAVEWQCRNHPFVGSQVFPSEVTSYHALSDGWLCHTTSLAFKGEFRLGTAPKPPTGTWKTTGSSSCLAMLFVQRDSCERDITATVVTFTGSARVCQDICSFTYAASLLTISSAADGPARRGHWIRS